MNTIIHNISAVIVQTPTNDPVIIPCWNDSPCELLPSEVGGVLPSSSIGLEISVYNYLLI